MSRVLLTGGMGCIGSHAAMVLAEAWQAPFVASFLAMMFFGIASL